MRTIYMGKMYFSAFRVLGDAYGITAPRQEKEHVGDNVRSVQYVEVPYHGGNLVYKCDNVDLWLIQYDWREG